MKEVECIVTGKVQGVTYRDFAQKKARALWLSGYVENLSNLSVKVVAQGKEENIERLLEHLWKGPFGSRISNVSVDWKDPVGTYNDFAIHY